MKMHEWRRTEGLTQQEAAERCGVDAVSWSLWENGKRTPSQKTAGKILEGSKGAIRPEDLGLSLTVTEEDALVARVAERVVRQVLDQLADSLGLAVVPKG